MPPALFPLLSQRLLAPSVTTFVTVAYYKGNNKMIPGALHRSRGISIANVENPGKRQVGDSLLKGLCDQSSPQMGSRFSK